MQGSDLRRRAGVEGGLVAGFAARGVGDVTGLEPTAGQSEENFLHTFSLMSADLLDVAGDGLTCLTVDDSQCG